MKNIVIINLHRKAFGADASGGFFEDVQIREYMDDLKAFGKSINKTVLFGITAPENITADFDNYAEIKYTGALSDTEKIFYKEFLGRFMRDWEYLPHGYAEEISLPFTVIYERLADVSYEEA